MQISLRSQMIAGVAAVGAVAIAVNPTIQPDVIPSMQRVAAAVQLSAVANPISAVGTVLQYLNSDIFSSIYADDYYGGYLNWPSPEALGGNGYNFYSWYETCANQANCDANPQVKEAFYGLQYSPGYLGLIPDFVKQFSFGGLAALANNFSEYGQAALAIPLALVTDGSQALFNAPGALVAAIQQLAAGDSAGAIATLKDEILAPLTAGVEQSFNALSYIVNNVIANLQSVINIGLPGLLGDVSKQIAAGAAYMVQSAVYTVQAVFQDISKLDFKQAWNDSIYGFLGPNGTLGQFESLTAGLGVIQYDDVNQSWGVTIPSIRSVLTSWGQHLGGYRLEYVPIDQTDGYPKIVEGGGCSADDASGASGTCRWGGILNDPLFTPPVSSASSVAPSAAATRGRGRLPRLRPRRKQPRWRRPHRRRARPRSPHRTTPCRSLMSPCRSVMSLPMRRRRPIHSQRRAVPADRIRGPAVRPGPLPARERPHIKRVGTGPPVRPPRLARATDPRTSQIRRCPSFGRGTVLVWRTPANLFSELRLLILYSENHRNDSVDLGYRMLFRRSIAVASSSASSLLVALQRHIREVLSICPCLCRVASSRVTGLFVAQLILS